jgi:Ca-activated chloride channel family protein
MTFLAAPMLLALVAVPVVVGLQMRAARRRARARAELAAQALVITNDGPAGAPRRWRPEHLPFVLFAVALTFLLVGAARPELELGVPQRQGTVVLAFDSSNSMLAQDIAPNRLEAAKQAARRFVEDQPAEIRIGVVAFGDGGVVLQPPTPDRADVSAAIDRLGAQGGTSVGQGLFASLTAVAGEPLAIDPETLAAGGEGDDIDIGYYGSSAIILLSDGEDTGSADTMAVAQLAAAAGTRVFTVGLGNEAGTVVEIDGFSIATALDVELLRALAEATGGTYSNAADAATLDDVYRSLDLEFVRPGEPTEVTALFAGVGGALAILAATLSLAWFGRVV